MFKVSLAITVLILIIHIILLFIGITVVSPQTQGSVWFTYKSFSILFKPIGIALISAILFSILYSLWYWKRGLIIKKFRQYIAFVFMITYLLAVIPHLLEIYIIVITSFKA